jgi:hypothetical protein
MEDMSRMSRTRRRSRSRRHSSHRSRSHSPRESSSGGNNSQDNNVKQPQFIPIPVPYYQAPTQSQQISSQPTTQTSNITSNNNNNNNHNHNHNQPMSYIIQPPKQQFVEEFIPQTVKNLVFIFDLTKKYFIYSGKTNKYVSVCIWSTTIIISFKSNSTCLCHSLSC